MKKLKLIATLCIGLFWYCSIAQTIEIHQIDIGVGDATLINIKKDQYHIDHSILIDAGKKAAAKDVIQYLDNYAKHVDDVNGNDKVYIDYIISSHYHEDHIGGLVGVLEGQNKRSIKRQRNDACPVNSYTGILKDTTIKYFAVLDKGNSNPTATSEVYKDYKSFAGNRRVTVGNGGNDHISAPAATIPASVPDANQSLKLGGYIDLGTDENNVPIRLRLILADARVYDPNAFNNTQDIAFNNGVNRANPSSKSNANNWGLGWVLEYGAFRYYTAGDVGGETTASYFDIETTMSTALPHIYTLPADAKGHICAQKISHHGSEHSSNQAFLDTLKSSLVVISSGTRFDHPKQTTIDRLEKEGWVHRNSLTHDSLYTYLMTELFLHREMNLNKGFTSGSKYWITDQTVPANLKLFTYNMINGQSLYQVPHSSEKDGDIVIKVYPKDDNNVSISTLSAFKVDYYKYDGTILTKSINCHRQPNIPLQ